MSNLKLLKNIYLPLLYISLIKSEIYLIFYNHMQSRAFGHASVLGNLYIYIYNYAKYQIDYTYKVL